jgi:hypothetical protein
MVSLDASGLLFILFRCPCGIHVLDKDSIGGLAAATRVACFDLVRQMGSVLMQQ